MSKPEQPTPKEVIGDLVEKSSSEMVQQEWFGWGANNIKGMRPLSAGMKISKIDPEISQAPTNPSE